MKLKESVAAKIAAIILSFVMVITLALSVSFTAVMGYYKFYFSNAETVKSEILTDMADREARYVGQLLDKGTDLDKYYKDKNVFYKITYTEDKGVITNHKDEEYLVKGTSEYYRYDDFYYTDENGNQYGDFKEVFLANIEVFIAKDMTKNDIFSVTAKIIDIGYYLRFAMVFIALAALVLLIVLLSFLYCAAGHRQGGVIKCNYLDMLPFDIYTAVVGAIAFFSILAVDGWSYDMTSAIFWIAVVGSIDYFVALGYTMSFATRVKTQTLLKNTVIYRVLRFLGKYLSRFFDWIRYIFSNLNLVYKTVIILSVLIIIEFIALIIAFNTYWYYGPSSVIGWVIVFNIIFIAIVLYLAIILQKIKIGGEKIAKGDLAHKIDTKYMFGDFKDFCGSLNNINEGLQTAVNERMKSEHFKTELITNVSHDIKTPLTSIINYVDLIKKEEVKNENVSQYIEVLDRQSARLKKLVEDLVEASKASSGALAVSLTPCDVGVLLAQTVGEFEDRLRKNSIISVLKLPENPVKIMADARHLWRVFENLMSNVCKYALGGTRVYLDVSQKGDRVYITFRNISKFELNVSADELMERFVRGDTSRNTEGSGLGLSIARSLVELQNGDFDLCVDGDLFKVTVKFDAIN